MTGKPWTARDNRIWVDGAGLRWSDLDVPELPPRCAYLTDRQRPALSAVWAAAHQRGEVLITSPSRVDAQEAERLLAEGFTIVSGESTTPPKVHAEQVLGRVWLTTSGSTGRPKRVAHTLDTLTTVTASQPARTWLLPYSPGTYAWWQLVTLALAHPAQGLVAVNPADLDRWPAIAADAGVDAISGTPTFWRQALWRAAEQVAALPLVQVTLGGEPVDQAILDQLGAFFPRARISWIYASSEAGASIAVHDGRAGFPKQWLGRESPDRPQLRVDNDELVIASPHHAVGQDGPIRTGDRVELHGDRIHIVGRVDSDEINVGGSKVSASAVRRALLAHPQVAWANARGRKAPVVGTLVQAEVVLRVPTSEAELTAWCAERLPDYAVPRRFRVRPEIPIKESLKSDV